VTVYRGTVPDRPIVLKAMRHTEATVTSPARAGDVVEVPCPAMTDEDCQHPDSGYRNDASEHVLSVRLTEDPELMMPTTYMDGGWLIVGDVES
jgi:hypothetical protein